MEARKDEVFRLPTWKVILNAFQVVWVMRDDLLKKLSLSYVLIILLESVGKSIDEESRYLGYTVLLLTPIFYTYFAVICHRLVILGSESVPPFGIQKLTMREMRFLGWVVSFWLVLMLFIESRSVVARLLFPLFGISDVTAFYIPIIITVVPAMYFLSRLSMIFPAAAIGKKPGIKWAWNISEGNGWRLLLIVGVIPSILIIIQIYLEKADTTVIEDIVNSMLAFVVSIIEISVISLSYKELSKRKPNNRFQSDTATLRA
jgi:hypothetical protein